MLLFSHQPKELLKHPDAVFQHAQVNILVGGVQRAAVGDHPQHEGVGDPEKKQKRDTIFMYSIFYRSISMGDVDKEQAKIILQAHGVSPYRVENGYIEVNLPKTGMLPEKESSLIEAMKNAGWQMVRKNKAKGVLEFLDPQTPEGKEMLEFFNSAMAGYERKTLVDSLKINDKGLEYINNVFPWLNKYIPLSSIVELEYRYRVGLSFYDKNGRRIYKFKILDPSKVMVFLESKGIKVRPGNHWTVPRIILVVFLSVFFSFLGIIFLTRMLYPMLAQHH